MHNIPACVVDRDRGRFVIVGSSYSVDSDKWRFAFFAAFVSILTEELLD